MLFDSRSIRLDPKRVHPEDDRTPAVVEGVEEDLDVVVDLDLVPVGQAGGRRAVGLEGADAEVDGVGGVPDQNLGVVVRGEPVDRLVL